MSIFDILISEPVFSQRNNYSVETYRSQMQVNTNCVLFCFIGRAVTLTSCQLSRVRSRHSNATNAEKNTRPNFEFCLPDFLRLTLRRLSRKLHACQKCIRQPHVVPPMYSPWVAREYFGAYRRPCNGREFCYLPRFSAYRFYPTLPSVLGHRYLQPYCTMYFCLRGGPPVYSYVQSLRCTAAKINWKRSPALDVYI